MDSDVDDDDDDYEDIDSDDDDDGDCVDENELMDNAELEEKMEH